MRLLGWLAAVLAMLTTLTIVAGELTDAGQRRWWAARPLTTDTVAGLLVLLVTVLVVNQLLNMRQARQRGHAVAAQAAIMVAEAARSAKAVLSVIDGSGDRGAAFDGFRTYMMMLLTGAPVLIDDLDMTPPADGRPLGRSSPPPASCSPPTWRGRGRQPGQPGEVTPGQFTQRRLPAHHRRRCA